MLELISQSSRHVSARVPAPTGAIDDDARAYERMNLTSGHVGVLVQRGISPAVAEARGVYSATTTESLAELGFQRWQQLTPALVIPIYNAIGAVSTYQIRPDAPRVKKDGSTVKYETRGKSAISLDVPPGSRERLRDVETPLYITEGPLKADAAVTHGLCCIAVLGVWNFGRAAQVLADWDNIVLKGRTVYVAFDSDVMEKVQVHTAVKRLKAFLEQRHAYVRIVYLPEGDGGKVGLDDFLAAGHTVKDLVACSTTELRPLPQSPLVMEVYPYRQTIDGIVHLRFKGEDEIEIPITNFPARIRSEVILDDGSDETERRYEIEALVRGHKRVATVSAADFHSLKFVSDLGVGAIVHAGSGTRDHARAAIQLFSANATEVHVYTHTGFRKIGDQWVYLSGGGAIGEEGVVPSVRVELPGALSKYILPAPLQGHALQQTVRASLELLEVAKDEIMVPLLGAVYRSVLGTVDVSVHVYGETGQGKSQLLGLMQQHFGAAMDASHLPASWSSTANYLAGLQHAAKDAILGIDDFVVQGRRFDVQGMHQKAERVFRGQGNLAGRGRAHIDGTPAAAKPPRGMTVSTGEERPQGQSLAARRYDIEVTRGDVNFDRLGTFQERALAGVCAHALAGYVRWLAGRYERVQAELPMRVKEHRTAVAAAGQHRRTPQTFAELVLGWQYFLEFAREVGALTLHEQDAYWNRAWDALVRAAEQQVEAQQDLDPMQYFLELLQSAINGSQAHLASLSGSLPDIPESFGWRQREQRVLDADGGEYDAEAIEILPQGPRIGWIDGDDLYLEPNAAYQAARRMAESLDQPLNIQPTTLKRRLHERGYLVTTEANRNRKTVRKTIQGKRIEVLHLHRNAVCPEAASPRSPSTQDEIEGKLDADRQTDDGQNSGTVLAQDGVARPINADQRMPVSRSGKGQRGSNSVTGTHGTVGTANFATGEPIQVWEGEAFLACNCPSHKKYWTTPDRCTMCDVCHPHPSRSGHARSAADLFP